MIQPALWIKAVRECRTLWIATGVILFAFCWLRVWMVGLVPMQNFATIIEQLPQVKRFLPVEVSQLFTFPGRIALTFDELITVMGIAVWSISRGSDVVSGELARGALEMVLGQPVGRREFFWSKTMVGLGGLTLLVALCWAGVAVGIHTTQVEQAVPVPMVDPVMTLVRPPTVRGPLSAEVRAAWFVPPSINLWALGLFLYGLAALASSVDRYRWRTIGITSGIFAVSIVVKIVALAAENLHWLKALTFLSAYEPQRIVQFAVSQPEQLWRLWQVTEEGWQLAPLGMNLILAGLGVLMLLVASETFARRDLPAPC